MKIFVKLFVVTLWIAILLSTFTACSKGTSSKQELLIGITQIATHPGIDSIRKGFIDQLKADGYVDGKNIKLIQSNANGDMSAAKNISQNLVSKKCNLIFAISTPSSQTVAKSIKGTPIPLVFGAVTDPVSAGLVKTIELPGGNITGTSDKWPINEQFDLLLKLVNNVKTVGVIYNPGETNSESNLKEIEKVCQNKGLNIVKKAVSSTNDVSQAAVSLVGKCDAFYVPADNTVIAAMEAVVKVSEKNKIPLLPGVSSNVEQGGFGTLGPDYYDIGRESGKIAVEILKGKKAGDISVATAKKNEYYFNLRSAKSTGVIIPKDLIDKAVKVY